MRLTIFHTNDLHGRLTPQKAERIRQLRSLEEQSVLFDSGDCIKAGNLAVPMAPDPAWELLASAGCDAGTLGNRETHILAAAFRAKIAGARHPLLCANLRTKSGDSPLPGSIVLERFGLRVGVVGVMVPMVTERMAAKAASAYLWDPPIAFAKKEAEGLRGKVDLMIALTHIGIKQDLRLAEECPLFDFILGGHSHTVLSEPVHVGDTFVCQGGAYGVYVGRYVWEKRRVLLEAALIPLL